ncbi:MAG: hypothetical protein J7M19_03590 [Planctomycetes bacterium]|nr:hypothetical protein [Planctomycetota bacterium]
MTTPDDATEQEIRGLIGRLVDYSLRSAARRRLLVIGRPAVGALVEALDSKVEGVAWAAATTLGEIGAEEAVDGLVKSLSSPIAEGAKLEALHRITGRDYSKGAGFGQPAAEIKPVATVADNELAEALVSDTISAKRHKTGCTFTVLLAGGRHQDVEMMLSFKDTGGLPLVAFYTECGPANPEKFEWALKTNLKVPFGAFAIRETTGGDKFVMVDAYLRESATTHQLRRALEVLAKRADAMERELTGSDSN